jgi:hypothetical protein
MAKSEDQQAAEMLREVENRIVWIAAFLVNRGTTKALNSACAKAADEALDEYQTRFPAIKPPA